MDFSTLLFEVDDAGVAVVTINRPDKLNALNATVIDELEQCFQAAKDNEDVKGVILTGSGEKSFVAGADISQFQHLDTTTGQTFARRGQEVFNLIEQLGKPVIAAVNGYALGGGCELAIACHLRIAAETARFGQPEVNLGILPGYGATQRLPRLVGLGIARELVLTGAMISAQRAYEIGLVNKVSTPATLLDDAREMMGTIISKAPIAIQFSLTALQASDTPQAAGLELEASLFGHIFATEDVKEGVSAFLEKRKPKFVGK